LSLLFKRDLAKLRGAFSVCTTTKATPLLPVAKGALATRQCASAQRQKYPTPDRPNRPAAPAPCSSAIIVPLGLIIPLHRLLRKVERESRKPASPKKAGESSRVDDLQSCGFWQDSSVLLPNLDTLANEVRAIPPPPPRDQCSLQGLFL